MVFAEEYARAQAPVRIGHIGVELIGPTLLAFGTPEQKDRFLPDIAAGRAIWCQGYSEPDAGSDLAAIRTHARLNGDRYIIQGQKIWTSWSMFADWIFVLARTAQGSAGRRGLSFLLVPLRRPGITVRPIRQITGEAEFAEIFFDEANSRVADRIGAEGEGWKIAMALLGFERGASTLSQQMNFRNELTAVIAAARARGRLADPLIRHRLVDAHIGLTIMRASALRMLASSAQGTLSNAGYTYKLYWASWRRNLGELAMDVLGQDGECADSDGRFHELTRLYLASRADTIYAGTNEIQRNIIAERALQLPREPRGP